MNIHGGPKVRDTWGFNPEVQFFARLGYAVFQVNYRGSTGYGRTYSGENFIDVCRYVVEDVADASRWAVAKGYADAERIAIYGSSFGGYAALAGVAFKPKLYRCAIGYAAVYDWIMQLKDDRRDSWLRHIEFEWRSDFYLDVDTHKDEYKAVSPRYFAEDIRAPVLIIHGGSDSRVWQRQAKAMRAALRQANKTHKVVINSWGVHGLPDEKKRIDFYVKVAEFLARHL